MSSGNERLNGGDSDGMNTPPPAVVIGLHTMQGLQTARLIRRCGGKVYGVSSVDRHPFNRTRHCAEVIVRGERTTSEVLLDLAERLPEPAVLVPCLDGAVREVSRRRDELSERFLFRLPPADVVELLMDKASFQKHAESIGLPVPEARILTTRAEAATAAATMTFPCVLKPTSRPMKWSANTSAKAFYVNDGMQLLEIYDRVHGWADSLVVQQWVVGPESNLFSVNGYFDSAGTSLTTFVARKLRQWPVRTGQSSFGVECRNDAVLDLYHRLFSSVAYQGLAYLEVKQDERTGQHYLIEPNIGRPTGRSAIAEAGGVELIDTMFSDIVGRPLPSARVQHYGEAKWIHLRRDLMSSAVSARDGDLTLGDWWRSMRGPKVSAIWDRSDPAPFLGDLVDHGRGALVSGAKRLGRLAVRARAGRSHFEGRHLEGRHRR